MPFTLLGSLLRGTDWSQVTEYLSPVFFQVVPPLAMAGQVSTLAADFVNKHKFTKLCGDLGPALAQMHLPAPVPPGGHAFAPASKLDQSAAKERGDLLLKLYFWQLLKAPTVILDLRQAAFCAASGPNDETIWQPQPLFITYEPAFLSGLRDLYLGFYLDDMARFDRALAALELRHAKQLFLMHFGEGQSDQRFDLAEFRSPFHRVFLACTDGKSRIHPNFLGVGAGLFCLYEHLEKLGGRYDVRAAFAAANGAA